MSAPTRRENYESRLYNKKPDLLGRKCALPRIPEEDFDKIIEADFFGLTDATLSTGETIKVPKNWIPKSAWFRDECFLAACGLGHMFSKRMRLSLYPPEFIFVCSIFLSKLFYDIDQLPSFCRGSIKHVADGENPKAILCCHPQGACGKGCG